VTNNFQPLVPVYGTRLKANVESLVTPDIWQTRFYSA